MKLLTGPTGWREIDDRFVFACFYKGVETCCVTYELLALKNHPWDPQWLKNLRKILSTRI